MIKSFTMQTTIPVFLLLFLLISSCDYLEYDESANYSKEDVFSNYERSKQFLTDLYSRLPTGLNTVDGAMRSSGSDDAEEVNDFETVQTFNDGSWSPTRLVDTKWGEMYDAIRSANQFLQNFTIESLDDRQFNANYQELLRQARLFPDQARVLRVYYYFLLLKRYENIPLIVQSLEQDEANTVKPSTFEEMVDFIVAECDKAMKNLPVSYANLPGQETGRVTRGAAMALKARVLLYAASPLHNTAADQQKWIDAAEAAYAIIDSSYYSLENDYVNAVNRRTSSELIWGRRRSANNAFERANFPIGYEGAEPGTAPTQNLVDTYQMQTTGKDIGEPSSGYDSANPYANRDPRLKATIIVNNSQWKGRPVEIWNGGRDAPPQNFATETGYYLKKYVVESVSLDPNNVTQANHTWVMFRYGEVLLNYAEAMNEAYGPNEAAGMGMTAVEAANQIRRRVNMPEFSSGFSQSEFREKLRNERRVELAFENHRLWDIRRWQIGPSTTDIDGMEITQNGDGSFTYKRKDVEDRVWEDRMYLYPIPQTEVFKNDDLQQNTGW